MCDKNQKKWRRPGAIHSLIFKLDYSTELVVYNQQGTLAQTGAAIK